MKDKTAKNDSMLVLEIRDLIKRIHTEPGNVRSDEVTHLLHRCRTYVEAQAEGGDCKFNCRQKLIQVFNSGWSFGRFTRYDNGQSWEHHCANKKALH